MDHKTFLNFLSQLLDSGRSEIEVEEGLIVSIDNVSDVWKISTQFIYRDSSELPPVLKWQEKGAYLRLDKKSCLASLMQTVTPVGRYSCFKALIQDFVALALEWKKIL